MKKTFTAAAFALAACSSTVPEGTTAEPVTYDALYGKLAAAYCERVFSCCAMDERSLIGIIPYTDQRPEIADAAACTTYMTDFLHSQGRIAAIASSVADGSVDYDPQAAGDCLAEYAAISCDEFGHDVAGARDMRMCSPYVASLAVGAACAWDEQCPSGYCAQPDAGGDPVCRDKPAAGDFCPVAVCADGLFCDSLGDSTCKAKLANGLDCTFHPDCLSGFCSYDVGTGDTGICSVEAAPLCDGS